jgi:thiol-disulfide isomerase/thioredoxin
MNALKKNLPLIVKILIAALFLLSAIAKSFPIWAFEKQLVDLGIVDWCKAPYLARLIIALETAIAFAILQKNYLKSIVIPITILLLAAFCIHLSMQMYEHGAMNGNCGCFGQLIPMTPLEAFIKNIITILLLVYLYKNVSDKEKGENRFSFLLLLYFFSAFLMFALFPFCPCSKSDTNVIVAPPIDTTNEINAPVIDTSSTEKVIATTDTLKKVKPINSTDTGSKKVVAIIEPSKTISKFSIFTEFSGKKIALDEGKKIVCLFVPGCDHCRDAAKEIVALSKKHKLPPVYVIFMNEEVYKIPEFFQEIKTTYPYYILNDIPAFFKLLGNRATTPGINYLWNGNIIKAYEGLETNKFNPNEMMQMIESNKY